MLPKNVSDNGHDEGEAALMAKDWLDTAALIGFYAAIHAAANWAWDNTENGRKWKAWLQNWRTGSFLHLILCALTVWTFGVCAILALGLALRGC